MMTWVTQIIASVSEVGLGSLLFGVVELVLDGGVTGVGLGVGVGIETGMSHDEESLDNSYPEVHDVQALVDP